MSDLAFLDTLEALVAERIADAPAGSYTAALAQQGVVKVAQKLGEEAIELALAAAAESDAQVREESADLVFHLLVLLAVRGVRLSDVVATLEDRHTAKKGSDPFSAEKGSDPFFESK